MFSTPPQPISSLLLLLACALLATVAPPGAVHAAPPRELKQVAHHRILKRSLESVTGRKLERIEGLPDAKPDTVHPSPSQDEEEIVTIKEDLLDQSRQSQSPRVGEEVGTVEDAEEEETTVPRTKAKPSKMSPQDNTIPDHKETAENLAAEIDKKREEEKNGLSKYAPQKLQGIDPPKPPLAPLENTKPPKGVKVRSKRAVEIINLSDKMEPEIMSEIADIGKRMEQTDQISPEYTVVDGDTNGDSIISLDDLASGDDGQNDGDVPEGAVELLEPLAIVQVDEDGDDDDDGGDGDDGDLLEDIENAQDSSGDDDNRVVKRDVGGGLDGSLGSTDLSELVDLLQSQSGGSSSGDQPIILVVDDGDDDDEANDDDGESTLNPAEGLDLNDDESSIQFIPIQLADGNDDDDDVDDDYNDDDDDVSLDKRGGSEDEDEIQIIPVEIRDIDDETENDDADFNDGIDLSSILNNKDDSDNAEDDGIQIIPVAIMDDGEGDNIDEDDDDDVQVLSSDQLNSAVGELLHRERRARLYGKLAYSNFYRNPKYSLFNDMYGGRSYGKRSNGDSDDDDDDDDAGSEEPLDVQIIPIEIGDDGDGDDDDNVSMDQPIIDLIGDNGDDNDDGDDDNIEGNLDELADESTGEEPQIIVMELPDEDVSQLLGGSKRVGKRTKYDAKEELQDRLARLVDQLKSK